jgi:hypothetical protein
VGNLAFALGLLVAQPALAKKPPSFALWSVREFNHESALTDPVVEKCQKAFVHNDRAAEGLRPLG